MHESTIGRSEVKREMIKPGHGPGVEGTGVEGTYKQELKACSKNT